MNKPFCEPIYTPPRPHGRPRKAATALTNRQATGTTSLENQTDNTASKAAQGSFAVVPVPPRLLNLLNAARYLDVSIWSLREWVALGIVPRIRVPLPNTEKRRGGEMRKVLLDRADLDKLVESWKA